MTEPVLTEGDRQSACWQKLKAHFEARLTVLRARNDAELSPEKTQRLRGHIAAVKELLALDNPAKPLPSEDALFKD